MIAESVAGTFAPKAWVIVSSGTVFIAATRLREARWRVLLVDIPLVVAGVALLYGVVWASTTLGPAGIRWISDASRASHLLLAVSGIVISLVLFGMRLWLRLWYGALEILVACVGLLIYPVGPQSHSGSLDVATTAWILGMMSLIYIAIRGLDNVSVGLKERRLREQAALRP